MSNKDTSAKGLEGVIIAESQLSYVNGQTGTLIYHGYPIETLARNATFEEVVYLLWHQKLPTQAELDSLKADFKANRAVPGELFDMMRSFPRDTHPMGVLRTLVSVLGMFDPEQEDNSPEATKRKAIRLTAQMATSMAAWGRIREGNDPVAPRDDLDHAANYLYMLKAEDSDPTAIRAFDAYLVMLADHGFNASTFTARVTTSTQGDLHSAIVAAIGTLKGPLHGGANERFMRSLLEIGSIDNTETWFRAKLDSGDRVMGIGHRVYKVEDPRAIVLREMAEQISAGGGDSTWIDIALNLKDYVAEEPYFTERKLFPNVEYYSAVVLYDIGIPIDFFTPAFALSRIAGWSAQILEQWSNNRLIRPKAEYVGPMDSEWVPIENR